MDKANIPRTWLVTDERMGEALWTALDRLPRGGGVLLRHYRDPARHRLAEKLAGVAAARGLVLAVARDVALARGIGARIVHNPSADPAGLPVSLSVHSLDEAEKANASGAALAFVSPLFATRSHPGAPAMTLDVARPVVARLDCPAIALGGMDATRFAELDGLGFHGWAGIDAWIRT